MGGIFGSGDQNQTRDDNSEHQIWKNDRADWLLSLLYAPPLDDEADRGISGSVRLQLLTFVLHKKLMNEFGEPSPFTFESTEYGPVDPAIFGTIEEFASNGLVPVILTDYDGSGEGQTITLTEKGSGKGESLFKGLSKNKQKLLQWIKFSPAHSPTESLFATVYRKYPEMFDTDFNIEL